MITNWRLLLLFAIFTAGMLCGAAMLRQGDSVVLLWLKNLFERYHHARAAQTLLATFSYSLLSSLLLIVPAYFCGLCAVGFPVVGLLPFLKGMGTGMLSGYLYAAHALKGLGYSLLLICPGTLFSTLSLLLCCKESIETSGRLFRVALYQELPREWGGIRIYSLRYAILFLLCVSGALLDAVLNRAFIGFFLF